MSIAQEIESLRKMEVSELVERYRELWGKAPRLKHRDWLRKRIAWKLQEKRFGGLSQVAKRRLEALIGEIELPLGEKGYGLSERAKAHRRPRELSVGTTLLRTWRGREIGVRVLEDGYEHDGVLYRSLSAVAKAVTGSHWNGRLFFGVTKRKKAR